MSDLIKFEKNQVYWYIDESTKKLSKSDSVETILRGSRPVFVLQTQKNGMGIVIPFSTSKNVRYSQLPSVELDDDGIVSVARIDNPMTIRMSSLGNFKGILKQDKADQIIESFIKFIGGRIELVREEDTSCLVIGDCYQEGVIPYNQALTYFPGTVWFPNDRSKLPTLAFEYVGLMVLNVVYNKIICVPLMKNDNVSVNIPDAIQFSYGGKHLYAAVNNIITIDTDTIGSIDYICMLRGGIIMGIIDHIIKYIKGELIYTKEGYVYTDQEQPVQDGSEDELLEAEQQEEEFAEVYDNVDTQYDEEELDEQLELREMEADQVEETIQEVEESKEIEEDFFRSIYYNPATERYDWPKTKIGHATGYDCDIMVASMTNSELNILLNGTFDKGCEVFGVSCGTLQKLRSIYRAMV